MIQIIFCLQKQEKYAIYWKIALIFFRRKVSDFGGQLQYWASLPGKPMGPAGPGNPTRPGFPEGPARP